MKFVAIISYTTNVQVGATVKANSRADAWGKLIKSLEDGDCVNSIAICDVLPDMELKK